MNWVNPGPSNLVEGGNYGKTTELVDPSEIEQNEWTDVEHQTVRNFIELPFIELPGGHDNYV